MNVLTIWEDDGGTTRINIPVDTVAIDMARYFREEIGIVTMLESADKPITYENESITYEESEAGRANSYMTEWRNFGGLKLSIVR